MKIKCIKFLKRNGWVGTYNGYVAIPKDNKYFGKKYDEVDVYVHGGLTFGQAVLDEGWLENAKFLDDDSIDSFGDLKNWWVLGFDTAHYGDCERTCPESYVINETNKLADFLTTE